MIKTFHPHVDPRDFLQLKTTFLDIWDHAESRKFLSFTGLPFTEDQVNAWFSDQQRLGIQYYGDLDAQNTLLGLAMTRQDILIGFVLYALAVHPLHQGKGVGRALCEYVIELARKDAFQCVDVQVFADNKKMLKLMLDLDFIPIRIDSHKRNDGMDLVVLRHYIEKQDPSP